MTAIMTILGMIPGLSALIQFVVGKYMDSKVAIYQTRMGVTKEVAVEAVRSETVNNQTKVNWLNAVANSRFLQFIVGGFAGPWIVYSWKVIVWDNIVHKFFWGTYAYTPTIHGNIGDGFNVIITGIFVTSAGMGLAASFLKKKD